MSFYRRQHQVVVVEPLSRSLGERPAAIVTGIGSVDSAVWRGGTGRAYAPAPAMGEIPPATNPGTELGANSEKDRPCLHVRS
jgi:hypothetical protein